MPDAKDDFYSVLSAAIDDMLVHGFDQIERVNAWTAKLREAAVRSMVRPESLDQALRDALADRYRKLVDRGEIVRYHPGVDRFTLERIKPKLRGELDRRIMASANLIKLNREEAINTTLRRFQGWSTSIPPGGVSGESKAEVRKTVRKSLASLPFHERRVIIDQSAKLISSINSILAGDGGAIAAQWVNHYNQPGYQFRPDHKKRDYRQNNGEPFLIRNSWAHAAGLVKKGKLGYVDDVTAPAEEPFCRCYQRFLYGLRELPEHMLTAKGKAALATAQGQQEVRSARTGRADSAESERRPGVGYEAIRMRLARLANAADVG